MRKIIAVVSATGALLLGGTGVASATAQPAPTTSSSVTTLADNGNNDDQHSDKTGLWGLLGLGGLFGLAGLRRRNAPADAGVGVGTRGRVS
jgi:hypothetical protein